VLTAEEGETGRSTKGLKPENLRGVVTHNLEAGGEIGDAECAQELAKQTGKVEVRFTCRSSRCFPWPARIRSRCDAEYDNRIATQNLRSQSD
jgi:hypothetical protein